MFVGFKGEWMTVKNELLYVGGLGKEWTSTTGELLNLNPQYVKTIDSQGTVQHLDWHENYNKVRSVHGVKYPGKYIHTYINVSLPWV